MKKNQMVALFCISCLFPFLTMIYLLREASILNIIVLIINIVACIVFFICLFLEIRHNKKTDSSIYFDKIGDDKNKVEPKEETLMNIEQQNNHSNTL